MAIAADAFLAEVRGFDVSAADAESCARAVEMLARVERVCRAQKAAAALRATAGGARGRDGSPDGAHWLAARSGESVSAARAALEVAGALGGGGCAGTAAAVASGELSLAQAREIASAVRANPGCEAELLEAARSSGFAGLREAARRRRHEGIGVEELHRRQRRARRFRWWTDELGMVAFAGALPPEDGVPLVNRVDAAADRLWRAARRRARADDDRRDGGGGDGGGVIDGREALAADALVAMTAGAGGAGGGGVGGRRSADVVVVVDLRAWRRGRAEGGEVCRIVGGSDVPVAVARELAADAFFKAVVHDGENILTVAHFGRRMSAELRTALDVGAPPGFFGVTCCEERCERRHGLEWDHVDPVANGGPTSYANLRPRCRGHHAEKTERDRIAGLLGQHLTTDRRTTDQSAHPDQPP
ncbi:MAG TPA: HNH endonuclease signature motif containing protein [Acidimicrobiales bacterium]